MGSVPVKKIKIFDLGFGNISSLVRCIERIDMGEVSIIRKACELNDASIVIIPGVGNFYQASKKITEIGLKKTLHKFVNENGGMVIGICLGAQILLDSSEEAPGFDGLSLIPGYSRHIKANNDYVGMLPHMGWCNVELLGDKKEMFATEIDNIDYYFVHNYEMIVPEGNLLARTDDGVTAIIGSAGRIFGLQFHPEKSSVAGEKILKELIGIGDEKENYSISVY